MSDAARRQQWARRSAMHYLSGRSSSTANLRRIMKGRAARRFPDAAPEETDALAEGAVRFCEEHGFVDDASYAEARVAAGVRKGHSRMKMAAMLSGKGISSEDAREALAEADDLRAAAAFARRRRIGPFRRGEADAAARMKEAAAMARAGFTGGMAREVLSMDAETAEDLAAGRAG